MTAARELELTLTSRSKDAAGGEIPMCGVPHHAIDGYLVRLVRKGYRVALCEQVEDPRKAKGLVRREVVRVVSPGTLTDNGYLESRESVFLGSDSPRWTREAHPRCFRHTDWRRPICRRASSASLSTPALPPLHR